MIRFLEKKTCLSTKQFCITKDTKLKTYLITYVISDGCFSKQFTNLKEMFNFIRSIIYNGITNCRCRSKEN